MGHTLPAECRLRYPTFSAKPGGEQGEGVKRDLDKLECGLVELCLASSEAKGRGERGAVHVQLSHKTLQVCKAVCLPVAHSTSWHRSLRCRQK